MMNYIIIYLISAVSLYTSFQVYASKCPNINNDVVEGVEKKLFSGQQKFTVDFLNKVLKSNPDKNIFFSTYSIYRALLLAYVGSQEKVERALFDTLNLQWSKDKDEVISAYQQDKDKRIKNAKSETKMEFVSVDKFYFDKKVEIRDCMKTTFDNEIELLDINGDPEQARKHINNWVEEVTRNHIKNLLPSESITKETKLAIANAAYFKGVWLSKFIKEDTIKDEFYEKPNQPILVDMMRQTKHFNLAINDELGCDILKMPYDKDNLAGYHISFVVFLPSVMKESALEEVLSKLTPELLIQSLTGGIYQKVSIKLPKFTFEKELKLPSLLREMGLADLFSNDADFSGFSESSNITFDDSIHKAKIEVDESGSRAAAATAFVGFGFTALASRPDNHKLFYANHPFMFMIYDETTQAILFTGVYRGPE